MSVDFGSLLKKPAGNAPKPIPLPAGDYQAIVKSIEYGDANKNKTPYARLQIGLIGWPDTVPEEARGQEVDGKWTPLDLSKRTMRKDFYLTEDSLHRLDKFLRSCGIDLAGVSYEEAIPKLVGVQITASVKQDVGQNSEVYATINDVIGPQPTA